MEIKDKKIEMERIIPNDLYEKAIDPEIRLEEIALKVSKIKYIGIFSNKYKK